MDAAQLAILSNALAPVLASLIVFAMPVALVFTVKHFKLRHRELELEAELHGKQTQIRLAAIEARLGSLEAALGALGRGTSTLQELIAMLEPPPTSADAPVESDPQRVRTR